MTSYNKFVLVTLIFILTNSADPDEMPHSVDCSISSRSILFTKDDHQILPYHARGSEVAVLPQHYCNIVSSPAITREVSGAVTPMDSGAAEALQTYRI